MSHQYRYPRVVEIHGPAQARPGRAPRASASTVHRTSQRELVMASLVRCPRGAGRAADETT